MPLLGGLFHRRRPDDGPDDGPDDAPPHLYTLPLAASASRLRLPFRRRADPAVMSDSGHGLPPPPPRSALFGVHNGSHHSLPTDSPTHARQSSEPALPPKSPGLFSWTRERTKSKPPPPSSSVSSVSSSTDDPSSSFSLKSFRHVRAHSPAPSHEQPRQPSSNALRPPARPRPRGDSVASDSSQRISVAAFREAHARSRANSPVSSFRPPSTADTLRADCNGRKRASTVSVVSATDRPQLNKNVPSAPTPSPRPDSALEDTSSDESDSEDDEDVDSDGQPIPKPARKRTITRRVDGIRPRSDIGHGTATTSIDQRSNARQDPPNLSKSTPPLTNQSDQAPSTQTCASVSTAALTPSGAARTPSILAATSSYMQPPKPNDESDESTDSSDTDSEDIPLSGLVAPRRPGSSASNRSNSRPRMPAKPLIDINSLAGGPPLLKPILRHENSVKNLNTKRKEQDNEKDQPFSIPAVLALSSSTSPPISQSVSNQNAVQANKPTPPAAHHGKSISDVSALTKPEEPSIDDDLMNAIRLVGALDKDKGQSSGTPNSSDRIVPTPIRAREPPTSFTVLSRPTQRQNTAETSTSLSSVSQAHSTTSPPTRSLLSESAARQRDLAMTKSTAQNDKSDAMSIISAPCSTASQSSSRIPPVPLIHSIPDSPSVKEDYKPGRPRSASAAKPSDGRSQLVSATPPSASNKMRSHGYQPSLMPQRPFASDRSIRGESPAGSSTGDSSSGRAPFTPRDGSDIGVRSKDDFSDVGSTLKARGHGKKPSVTFEDSQLARGRERTRSELTGEERTRERRRSEAKAALELGKIVNGRGPLVHDDSDDDMGPHGRNPTINVTTENGMQGMIPGWPAWQQPMATGMMVPPQFSSDPAYLAAHQRALLVAKQAYQMAVAQHAMQVAGEEWERSSNIGFSSSGSVYGGGSGGSVYGGGSGGSVYGGMGGGMAPMGMMGMPSMGMLMPPSQWARSSVAFPGTASVYGGISSSQSEFGGSGGWGSCSAYGDSFGPASSRSSFVGKDSPSSSTSAYGGNPRPRAWTGVSPPSTSSKAPGKTPARSRAAPPSSWKNVR